MNENFPDSDNQPSAPIIDETDEWPSIKEVRGKFDKTAYSMYEAIKLNNWHTNIRLSRSVLDPNEWGR